MGTPVTAITGKVEVNSAPLADITKWGLEETADNKTYVSSSTAGWTKTAEGAKSWKATLEILLDAGKFLTAPLVIGTLLTKVELWTSETPSTESRYGAARVDRITGLEADIGGSGLLKATVEVTGDGALT